ncbi:MAG: alanine racemase [Acholeplasmataceae bacterium]|nr:alanine racemase [Acholeplasmataceae bacterium]
MKNYRPTWAEINLDALYHNLQIAQKHAPHKTIIPVIKANGYGHGAVKIMKFLIEKGVDYFSVSTLEEALELRKINCNVHLLMMGPIQKNDLEAASKHDIEITLYDEEIIQHVLSSKLSLTCHLKIDTGMHRYGLMDEKFIIQAIEKLQNKTNIDLKGIYTHFATADSDEEFYNTQVDRFYKLLIKLKVKPPVIHMSNSSSTLNHEKDFDFTTYVRYGISLYGLTLESKKHNLKPVMKLKTRIVTVKSLKKDECVGYSQTYCAKEDEIIGVLPIGYADGFLRRNKHGDTEIQKRRYPLVGNICMDACFVKIDDSIKVGDIVTLFGGLITTDEVAKRNKTINYEIVTSISYRVPKKYVRRSS